MRKPVLLAILVFVYQSQAGYSWSSSSRSSGGGSRGGGSSGGASSGGGSGGASMSGVSSGGASSGGGSSHGSGGSGSGSSSGHGSGGGAPGKSSGSESGSGAPGGGSGSGSGSSSGHGSGGGAPGGGSGNGSGSGSGHGSGGGAPGGGSGSGSGSGSGHGSGGGAPGGGSGHGSGAGSGNGSGSGAPGGGSGSGSGSGSGHGSGGGAPGGGSDSGSGAQGGGSAGEGSGAQGSGSAGEGNAPEKGAEGSGQAQKPGIGQAGPGNAAAQGDSTGAANDLVALETHKALKTALNQSMANSVSPQTANEFLAGNPECNQQAVEGNWKVINEKIKQECRNKVNERKVKAEQIAKFITKPTPDKCVKKLNPNALVCQALTVMNTIIKQPRFKIDLYGSNVVEIKKDGSPILLGVAESLNYNVTKMKRKRYNPLKNPTARLEFNELGSLLKQEGEIPKPKRLDPCGSCLEKLSKKAQVEGEKDMCGGCDALMELNSLKRGSFNNLQTENKKPEVTPTETTKAAEESK